jgi:hypothetical protein
MHVLGAGQFLSSQLLTEKGGANAMGVVTFTLGFVVVVKALADAFTLLTVDVKVLTVDAKELATVVKVLAVDDQVLSGELKLLADVIKEVVDVSKVLAEVVKEFADVVRLFIALIVKRSVTIVSAAELESILDAVDASLDVDKAADWTLIDVGGVDDTGVDPLTAAIVAPLQNLIFVSGCTIFDGDITDLRLLLLTILCLKRLTNHSQLK